MPPENDPQNPKNENDPAKNPGEGDEPKPKEGDVPPKEGEKQPTQAELDARVQESLKPIKEKLDGAYSARDEALRKVAEYEAKEREREREKLKEEGKLKEAYELELQERDRIAAEKDAKLAEAEKRNVELTRDIEVNRELAALDFRNNKSRQMAFSEITKDLVQDENGNWVHKDGTPIADYIKRYSDDEDNNFLFKQKVSSGADLGKPNPTDVKSSSTDSLFSLSQDEVIKRVREGKLKK